ncbi:hypothetical protein K435DRAFT_905728, partial [Dendrothele bispora CBS 962.96]
KPGLPSCQTQGLHQQLKQTIIKLQTTLGFTPKQVSALSQPLTKIHELKQENARLIKDNNELHHLLRESSSPVIPLGNHVP